MNIQNKKKYTPNEVLAMGVMWQNTADSQRQMLLRFLRDGRLKSENVGTHLQPRYIISGKDLIKFLEIYGDNKRSNS